jgi:hypothetical protein
MIVIMLLIAGRSELNAQSSVPREHAKQEQIAVGFLNYLSQLDYSTAVGYFNQTMLEAFPEQKLKATWESILQGYGALQKIQDRGYVKAHGFDVITVQCVFEKARLEAKISYDAHQKIAGLFFVPITQKLTYSPPDYVNREAFQEKEIIIENGKFKLPGTISLPNGKGPFPAVVLIHGSGPHDRDERIGAIQPFKDLAWGLASNGIAVLRFVKRTKHYSKEIYEQYSGFTVQQETVSDAAAATRFLSAFAGIDTLKIVVLGHSLGGMLIPRIASKQDVASGYIMMAANARPLEDLIVEQHQYLFGMDNQISEAEQARLRELKRQIAHVKQKPINTRLKPEDLPLTIPVSYWADLQQYDQVSALKNMQQPVLLLHGERDFQVTMADYNIWKQVLSETSNVSLRLLPKLNHLMVSGEGKSSLEEYYIQGHVHYSVIESILEWFKERL